jgi:hypothetical protein
MFRTLIRLLAPLLVVLLCCLTPAAAQSDQAPIERPRLDTSAVPDKDKEKEQHIPALAYTVAGFSTLLVLVILCKPSRKPVPT